MVRIFQKSSSGIRSFKIEELERVEIANESVKFFFTNDESFEPEQEFIVRCDVTGEGKRFMEMFDIHKIVAVRAVKPCVSTEVFFKFSDGVKFSVIGAFNIGFSGTGPTALYDLLTNAGFEKAKGVFTRDITDFYIDRILT